VKTDWRYTLLKLRLFCFSTSRQQLVLRADIQLTVFVLSEVKYVSVPPVGVQCKKYLYIYGYFVASFPYFNGTSSVYVFLSVNWRNNEAWVDVVNDVWIGDQWHLWLWACLCVRVLKGKWFELSSPNLVHLQSMTGPQHALTQRSVGQVHDMTVTIWFLVLYGRLSWQFSFPVHAKRFLSLLRLSQYIGAQLVTRCVCLLCCRAEFDVFRCRMCQASSSSQPQVLVSCNFCSKPIACDGIGGVGRFGGRPGSMTSPPPPLAKLKVTTDIFLSLI